ncbi:MAG: hypothetical protein GXP26_08620 [Planctomycetes bacterium]|nr:hypothetical protein [Planctomycetota bacterium]
MAEALQEYVDSRGVTVRVDREQGVLRGVKLIGLESRNGRRYRESTLDQATSLYEEAKVNVNHPKDGPLSPRDYQDRLGVIRGVELRSGEGLFGDLHFNPKHLLAEQLVWDAEHNPRNVGFSHNVLARLSRESEVAIVEEITRVLSVDLVADPATTRGIFEDASQPQATDTAICTLPQWDALTLETLELHRPDLLKEIEAAESEQLRSQLEVSQSQANALQRRQRIFDLLREYQLPIPVSETSPKEQSDEAGEIISQAFFETLMGVAEEELESLVAERAELVRSATRWRNRFADAHGPQSREQTSLFAAPIAESPSAQEFAKTLKTIRN